MASSIEMCAICAWRETCNKKFNLSGRDVHCADFSEDLTIKRRSGEEASETEGINNG